MNFLKTLWSWLLKLMRCSPRMPVNISDLEKEPLDADCCEEECEPEEECCDHEDCEPAPEPIIEIHVKEEPVEGAIEVAPQQPSLTASELIRDLLLSEGATERQIEKFEIEKRFQKWYQGELTPAAVRESIPSFKAEVPACWISPKLNKVI